jgi:hypothetical protein
LLDTLRRAAAGLSSPGADEEAALLGEIAAGLAGRIEPLAARSAQVLRHSHHLGRLMPSYDHLAATIGAHEAETRQRAHAQALMELELEVSLLECWTRAAEIDLLVARA